MTSLNRMILGGIIISLCSSGVTELISLSSSNNSRDIKITELQTTVKEMNERLTEEHDEETQQLTNLTEQLRRVQIDTARISQKVGVPESLGAFR